MLVQCTSKLKPILIIYNKGWKRRASYHANMCLDWKHFSIINTNWCLRISHKTDRYRYANIKRKINKALIHVSWILHSCWCCMLSACNLSLSHSLRVKLGSMKYKYFITFYSLHFNSFLSLHRHTLYNSTMKLQYCPTSGLKESKSQ